MKKRKVVGIVLVLFLVSFVSAFSEKNFSVDNVYWAVDGTINEIDGTNRPFLFGLVKISWDTEKGRTSQPIVYFKYDNSEYYSSSLGLIPDLVESNVGLKEAQFYLLDENFASDEIGIDYVPRYTLFIPISSKGNIKFEDITFSRLNQGISLPTISHKEKYTGDIDLQISSGTASAECSKSSVMESSSVEMCGVMSAGNEEEVKDCWKEKGNILIQRTCSILCLKRFYSNSLDSQENKNIEDCFLYRNINFDRMTSNSLDFSELIKKDSNLEHFNPWRTGP